MAYAVETHDDFGICDVAEGLGFNRDQAIAEARELMAAGARWVQVYGPEGSDVVNFGVNADFTQASVA